MGDVPGMALLRAAWFVRVAAVLAQGHVHDPVVDVLMVQCLRTACNRGLALGAGKP